MKVLIIFNLLGSKYLAILASPCSFWLALLQIFVTCSLKFNLLSIVTPFSLTDLLPVISSSPDHVVLVIYDY